jgi:hypothetical protein
MLYNATAGERLRDTWKVLWCSLKLSGWPQKNWGRDPPKRLDFFPRGAVQILEVVVVVVTEKMCVWISGAKKERRLTHDMGVRGQ